MRKIQHLSNQCIADLNNILMEEINKDWQVNFLSLNSLSIAYLNFGYMHLHFNNEPKIEIHTNKIQYSKNMMNIDDPQCIKFYSVVSRFLSDKAFQEKILSRFYDYKKIGEKYN